MLEEAKGKLQANLAGSPETSAEKKSTLPTNWQTMA
jgi:hypothetical protein